ncbi:MAG: methylated-DNA--[protein]-cysteine S-methyltransferase [Clostridia bacterium]|nr:methylated-DNA--[protein]-cysteine S-methyltransferase [Clostridia bacterium]
MKKAMFAVNPNEEIGLYDSPLGLIELRADKKGITYLRFVEKTFDPVVRSQPDSLNVLAPASTIIHGNTPANKLLNQCRQELDEYFSGTRKQFEVPINLKGTAFQQKVWQCLPSIAYGKTACYQDIALTIGNVKASRAVGTAIGQNPVFLIVPCHRVIGKNGSLTCYACGVERKKWLLEHEKAQ